MLIRSGPIKNETEAILRCCTFSPDEPNKKKLQALFTDSFNWEFFVKTVFFHHMNPLVYHTLSKTFDNGHLPQDSIASLRSSYLTNAAYNTWLWDQFRQINTLCAQGGIPLVALRGIVFSHTFYPSSQLRLMQDIDVLVHREDVFRMRDILRGQGYHEIGDSLRDEYMLEHGSGTNFIKYEGRFKAIFNVHWEVAAARPYKICLSDLWDRIETVNVDGISVTTLSKEDCLISLALHLRRHTRALALKFIFDIAEFLRLYSQKIDWEYIEKNSKLNHMRSVMYFALSMADMLFTAPVPEGVKARLRLPLIKRALIQSLVKRENFFRLSKIKGILLRLLLFDRSKDVCLYVWRVSFIERFFRGSLLPKASQVKGFNIFVAR